MKKAQVEIWKLYIYCEERKYTDMQYSQTKNSNFRGFMLLDGENHMRDCKCL